MTVWRKMYQRKHVMDESQWRTWPPLAECVGNVPTLFSLGLARVAPAVRIGKYSHSETQAWMLRTLLAEIRPSHLAVRVSGAMALRHEHGILSVLGAPEACAVEALELEIALDSEDEQARSDLEQDTTAAGILVVRI